MKYIFLDIDGVLNSADYSESSFYLTATAGLSDAEIMLTNHHHHLDPNAINTLNDLVKRSGATVVLSSTWRGRYSPEEMTTMLKDRGATFEIKTATPKLFGKISSRIPRGKEIAHYLKMLEKQPEAFVILDDHDDMIHLKPFLVQTTMKHGLTQDDVEKALKILNPEK
jgi:tRNA(Met) C34 N-acetyltransferase TmcA